MSTENQSIPIEQLSFSQLSDFVSELIDRDFSRLVQILYRLDVSEEKLKLVLIENPTGDAGAIIAQIIVDRIAQREKTKDMFRMEREIPEDEKW